MRQFLRILGLIGAIAVVSGLLTYSKAHPSMLSLYDVLYGLFPALLVYVYYEVGDLKRRLRKLEYGAKIDETEHLLRMDS